MDNDKGAKSESTPEPKSSLILGAEILPTSPPVIVGGGTTCDMSRAGFAEKPRTTHGLRYMKALWSLGCGGSLRDCCFESYPGSFPQCARGVFLEVNFHG